MIGVARHVARQDDRLVGDADLDVFARKEHLELVLQRRRRRIDGDRRTAAASAAPDDQADRAGGLAVDQDFARLDHRRVGDRRIGDRDARDRSRSCTTVDPPDRRRITLTGAARRASRIRPARLGGCRRCGSIARPGRGRRRRTALRSLRDRLLERLPPRMASTVYGVSTGEPRPALGRARTASRAAARLGTRRVATGTAPGRRRAAPGARRSWPARRGRADCAASA